MLRIVTDGSIDMPKDWAKKFKIDILPLMIRFGEGKNICRAKISTRIIFMIL